MRRLVTSAAAVCCVAVLSTAAFAQTSKSAASTPAKKDATPAVAPAPAPVSEEVMRARMRPPVKGTASVDYVFAKPKVVKDEIVMSMQVKNTTSAPIAGFRVDVYFYKGKEEISAGTGRVRNPIAPGEIVDVAMTAPNKPGITGNTMRFSHANGAVQPTGVKSFDAPKKPAAAAPAKKK